MNGISKVGLQVELQYFTATPTTKYVTVKKKACQENPQLHGFLTLQIINTFKTKVQLSI